MYLLVMYCWPRWMHTFKLVEHCTVLGQCSQNCVWQRCSYWPTGWNPLASKARQYTNRFTMARPGIPASKVGVLDLREWYRPGRMQCTAMINPE
jgi:hypothetical protein